jgi:hypothetical protein
VARHIFQACPVWIYTQSNITSIIFTRVHYTNTEESWTIYQFNKTTTTCAMISFSQFFHGYHVIIRKFLYAVVSTHKYVNILIL